MDKGFNNKKDNAAKLRFWGLMAVAAVVLCVTVFMVKGRSSDLFEVSFLDVGNGDSAMLKTPKGDLILIDGGEAPNYKNAVVPAMSEHWRFKADKAIVTHFHSDHAGGIQELVRAGLSRELYMPDVEENEDEDAIKDDLVSNAVKNNIHYEYLSRNDKIEPKDKNLKIDVLFPDNGVFANEEKNVNNDSLVLRVQYFDTVFMFTGDLESDAEQVLVNSGNLDSDVLKVGHHGSDTSTSEQFLNAVSPKIVVISVGAKNKYGHPRPEVIKRLKNAGVKILRTDRNGKIVIYTAEGGIQKISMDRMAAKQELTDGNT